VARVLLYWNLKIGTIKYIMESVRVFKYHSVFNHLETIIVVQKMFFFLGLVIGKEVSGL
jgi:hypothetical protein